MAEQLEVERLNDIIERRYPYPLAATYYRAYFEAPEPLLAHDYLMSLFEVTLKYLTTIVLAQYFQDKQGDPKINTSLQNLRRPSLGHWQSWLRNILALYKRERRPLAMPELTQFYKQKHQGAIAWAFNRLEQIKNGAGSPGNKSVVTTQEFFNLLGEYRNMKAHSAAPGQYQREQAVEALIPAMRELFAAMQFVADYRLVYVREVTVDYDPANVAQMRFAHRLTYLIGDRPRIVGEP